MDLPLPITGFLKKCLHHKHTDKHKHECLQSRRQHNHGSDAQLSGQPHLAVSGHMTRMGGHMTKMGSHMANVGDHMTKMSSQMSNTCASSVSEQSLEQLLKEKLCSLSGKRSTESGMVPSSRNYLKESMSQSNKSLNLRSMGDESKGGSNFSSSSKLTRSRSESMLESKIFQDKTNVSGKQDYGLQGYKGDYSDISTDGSEIGEDYEGDQSDVDSEEEQETSHHNAHCTIV